MIFYRLDIWRNSFKWYSKTLKKRKPAEASCRKSVTNVCDDLITQYD